MDDVQCTVNTACQSGLLIPLFRRKLIESVRMVDCTSGLPAVPSRSNPAENTCVKKTNEMFDDL